MTTILVQKRNMSGAMGLFTRAVRPGAEVSFECAKPGFKVSFEGLSPLDGPEAFDIQVPGVTRTVLSDATEGTYLFNVEWADRKEHLELTVESTGIARVGFVAAPDTASEIGFTVQARQRIVVTGGGPLEIVFEKSVVNEQVSLDIYSKGETKPLRTVRLDSGETSKTVPIPSPVKASPLAVRLTGDFVESGGTEVVDIIVEGSGHPREELAGDASVRRSWLWRWLSSLLGGDRVVSASPRGGLE